MSFSYGMGSNPTIDYPRMLVGDTVEENHVWEDEEIQSFGRINQMTWQSGQFYSGSMGAYLPSQPVSYLRVAALMLDALASNKSRLLSVVKVLDVTLAADGSQKTASSLREQAKQWREVDDNSGAFVVIEQCTTSFGFLQRYRSQIQRQNAL